MSTSSPRIAALDSLRGIALFGILVVNWQFFAMPDGSFGLYNAATFQGFGDRLAAWLVSSFFAGKFILIFSFLFGWGLWTQMGRGDDFKARYFRRLAGLALIGAAHAIFLFFGDILVTYAVLGLVAYKVRNWEPRRLVKLAAVMWAISILFGLLLGTLETFAPAATLDETRKVIDLHLDPSFWALVPWRAEMTFYIYLAAPFLFAPQVIGMFALGLAAAKSFAGAGLGSARPLARKVIVWCTFPAVIGNVLYGLAMLEPATDASAIRYLLGSFLFSAFAPLLTLVYLAVACLWFSQHSSSRVASLLAGDGRMSLSIYIGESVLMSLAFNGYGLGLYGQVGHAYGFLMCVVAFALLVIFSKLWLSVFALGPLEWLLRFATELRAPKLIKS